MFDTEKRTVNEIATCQCNQDQKYIFTDLNTQTITIFGIKHSRCMKHTTDCIQNSIMFICKL